MKLKYLFISLFLIIALSSEAQNTATIRGFVYEKSTGEPVIYTNVFLEGTSIGAATDVNGYFAISMIPPGTYNLMITYLGMDTLKEEVILNAGDVISKNLQLSKAPFSLNIFYIDASAQEAKTETQTSVTKITPKQINSLPSIGTPDLAQYLQVLPGVIFTGDQGGQLYIRGGSPIQNKVLLDGMVIYNPFHSIGLFSVFDTDIMRNAEIYTGGFGAEYGGRISSIMDITTRDGNKKRMSGSVAVSPFLSKVLIEGPLKKQKDVNSGSSSFIISAKHSYLDQTSKEIYNYIDEDGLPYRFTDIYGKLSANGGNGSKINLFGFSFDDRVDYKQIAKYNWKSFGGGANFIVVPAASSALIEGIFAYSSYDISMVDQTELPKRSAINGFNGGLKFTYFIGKDQLTYGLEMLGFKTELEFYNSANRLIEQEDNTTELAGFLKYKMSLGKDEQFLIEPSFRVHFYASLSTLSPEPRLAMKYNITDHLRVKMAAGLYSQNLISSSSDRDVVNLFYGFISGPENIQRQFEGENITHKLQKSQHLIAGVEYDIVLNEKKRMMIVVNLEGYYKNFSQLTNINKNKVYDDEPEYSDKPDYLKKDFVIEKGYAKGFDVSLKFDYRRIYLWSVYSLGYVNRFDGIIEYVPHYDRRHNVNLVGTYKAGKAYNWEFSVRWNFGSGFPFTLTQGFYPQLTFSDGITSDYITSNEELGIIYADINTGRLPYYHRLDISVKKKFFVSENSQIDVMLSITNAYDRQNIFYFDRISYSRVDQLPIMPSMGVVWKF
jgi:CarboxypepD_reg-like domain/TonB-dependent Receptor Plug Domain